jgi:hypothetical protein
LQGPLFIFQLVRIAVKIECRFIFGGSCFFIIRFTTGITAGTAIAPVAISFNDFLLSIFKSWMFDVDVEGAFEIAN